MAKHENVKRNINIRYFLSPIHTQPNEIANFGVLMTMWASLEMQKQGLYAKNHNGHVKICLLQKLSGHFWIYAHFLQRHNAIRMQF
mgnify:CR=1 FL=1